MKNVEKSKSVRAGLRKGFSVGCFLDSPAQVLRIRHWSRCGPIIDLDEAIASDKMFNAVQKEKMRRGNSPERERPIEMVFSITEGRHKAVQTIKPLADGVQTIDMTDLLKAPRSHSNHQWRGICFEKAADITF